MEREAARRATTAARTTPISTAQIRSKETVISAVTAKIQASERVEVMIERATCTFTIRIAVMNSTPASAAIGIIPTGPEAT